MASEDERWQRRVERERHARKEAERLLEEKSLALYNANLQLQAAAADLEQQVLHRTQELQAALDQARQATRAKGDFLATMSHEIRTPMNGMLGMAELLHHSPLSGEQRAHVDVIRTSGEALLALINDILDFSKIEAGRMTLEARPFSLTHELQSLRGLFEPIVLKKGLQFRSSIAADLPQQVVGDSVRLRQVISNLLSNAIKFTATGDINLEVRAQTMPDARLALHVAVRDTGIGIPVDRRDRLFKAFSQVDSSTTREYGGTGLGLAICARLVQAMGGAIHVHSTPGVGSSFEFHVMLGATIAAGNPAPLASAPTDGETSTPHFGHLNVLLVEDHVVNQTLALKLLERLGIRADLASDGAQAVGSVRGGAYDIVLMDMQMPVMDGLAATRAIRELDLPLQPFIIALTANAFDSDREMCLQAGMDEFLAKPFRMETLREKIAAFRRPT